MDFSKTNGYDAPETCSFFDLTKSVSNYEMSRRHILHPKSAIRGHQKVVHQRLNITFRFEDEIAKKDRFEQKKKRSLRTTFEHTSFRSEKTIRHSRFPFGLTNPRIFPKLPP